VHRRCYHGVARIGSPQREELIDDRLARRELAPQVTPATIPRTDDLLEADGLPGEVRTDGTTEEVADVVDADLRHIGGVIADDHLLADRGGERRVEVAQPLEVDTIKSQVTQSGFSSEWLMRYVV